jgi:rod shape-determining protein MreC
VPIFPYKWPKLSTSNATFFKRKVFVDKGSNKNVIAGQVVMDETGLVGQVTRVFPWLSEITLITDKDHAVPIQVLRTGLRAVVFGSGNISNTELRYMPISSDIQVGDELVTSGIDGTYPPGLPVAKSYRLSETRPIRLRKFYAPPRGSGPATAAYDYYRPYKLPALPAEDVKRQNPKARN